MNQTQEQRVAAARARMAELKEKFVERSRGELATMRSGIAALETGEAAALGEILQLSHRMSGTGATLGLDALSERARHIEKLAEAHAPGALPDAAALSGLRAAIEALAAELARTPRGG
jgi:HPt (histidine-containing phosphotransfer) domain-containing protein